MIPKRILVPARLRRPPPTGWSWVDRRFVHEYAAHLSRDAVLVYFFLSAVADKLGSDGGVRALLVFGSNPAISAPRAGHIEKRLDELDFLMVSDFFLSETAEHADVVLPSAQWAEEEGTMTNLEGRVIYRQRATEPPFGARTDLEMISALVNPGDPATSRLLLHPLAPEAGGDIFHSGGRQFRSKDDAAWKSLVQWVNGAKLDDDARK